MKVTPTYRIERRPLDYVDIRLEPEEARVLRNQLRNQLRTDVVTHNIAMLINLETLLGEALRGELK